MADISFWKDELINEIRANAEEMEEMKVGWLCVCLFGWLVDWLFVCLVGRMIEILTQNFMRVVDQFLSDTKQPLMVAEECLMHREGRVGIDQVNDAVEKALSKV